MRRHIRGSTIQAGLGSRRVTLELEIRGKTRDTIAFAG
jgi:hypothetical protein